jgi:hypothetical protein
MSALVNFLKLVAVNSGGVRYKLLKNQLKSLLEKIESSMREFPDLMIEENQVIKLVPPIFIYVISLSKSCLMQSILSIISINFFY